MQENIIVIICGIFGVLFQCLLKIRSLLKDAQVANVTWSWKKDYLYKDAPSIILAFLSVGIWFYIFGEVQNKYAAIADLKRVSFVLMGGVGSYLIQMAFGTAKERIRKIVDRKTDVADGKVTKDELPTIKP
jgi:hypothetical protein